MESKLTLLESLLGYKNGPKNDPKNGSKSDPKKGVKMTPKIDPKKGPKMDQKRGQKGVKKGSKIGGTLKIRPIFNRNAISSGFTDSILGIFRHF